MEKRCSKGSLTVEAACFLVIFVMAFMLVVTIVSLCQTIMTNVKNATAGAAAGVGWMWTRAGIAILLVILAIVLAVEGIQTLTKQKK